MILHWIRLVLLLLWLAVVLGCDGSGPSSPDAEGTHPNDQEPVNYKDMLARCRFKLDQIRKEIQRLEEQRLGLLGKITQGGTLTTAEAQQQPNWRLFARQLKIVTDKQENFSDMATRLEQVIPKLEFALANRAEASRQQVSPTDDDLNTLLQASLEFDDAHRRDADTGVGEDFELEALVSEQLKQ